jgi:hypothetical protein
MDKLARVRFSSQNLVIIALTLSGVLEYWNIGFRIEIGPSYNLKKM